MMIVLLEKVGFYERKRTEKQDLQPEKAEPGVLRLRIAADRTGSEARKAHGL